MLACAALLAALVAPAYDNPLEVAVGSGESTLDLAQLSGHDAIVKTGGGTLVLPSIADFAGEIAILEGVVKVASEGALGNAAGKTVVAPGAQLYIDASTADLDFSAETMEIASLDGSVAVYVNNKGDAQKNLGVLRLSRDARVFFSKSYIWKTDCDLGGHTLSLNGSSGNVFLHRSGGTCSAGKIVVDKIRFLLRGGSVFQGDSGSVLETVNKATISFFNFTGSIPWTLLPRSSLTLDVRYAGGKDGNANIYDGPVDLSVASLSLARAATIENTGMTFAGKITGANGLVAGLGDIYKTLTVYITNPDNDFQGGAAFNGSTLHLPVSGALPSDGGPLHMKNGTLILTNELAYVLPSVIFEESGSVQGMKAIGEWREHLVKTGDGNLAYDTYIGAPVLDLQGGVFKLPPEIVTVVTNRHPGIYGGGRTFLKSDEVSEFYSGTECITNSSWYRPEMAYKCGTGDNWSANTAYTYDGYIWNRNATNEIWRFVVCMLTKGKIIIDGTNIVESALAARDDHPSGGAQMKSFVMTPGRHRIQMRMYVSSVGDSASSGGGAYQNNKDNWIANCGFTWGQRRGMMFDRYGREGKTFADFDYIVDSGDGHLLTLTDDEDTVIRKLPVFDTVVATNGTATLDLNGNDYAVSNLVGFPSLVNAGTFTVNNDWRLTSIGTVTCDGRVAFASDATLTVESRTPAGLGRGGETEWVVMTAEGGIEGCPRLNAPDVKGTWKISVDGNAMKLSFAPKGLAIVIR